MYIEATDHVTSSLPPPLVIELVPSIVKSLHILACGNAIIEAVGSTTFGGTSILMQPLAERILCLIGFTASGISLKERPSGHKTSFEISEETLQ